MKPPTDPKVFPFTADVADEKPLHARVAEALGAKPRKIRVKGTADHFVTIWDDNPYYSDGAHDEQTLRMTAGNLPRYDTDWSATGPLIEEHGISVTRDIDLPDDARWCASFLGGVSGFGRTPLIAVCEAFLHRAERARGAAWGPRDDARGV